MSYTKFKKDDIFVNRIKAYPQYDFLALNGELFINYHANLSGSNYEYATNVTGGYISLYELNIDRLPSLHTYNTAAGQDQDSYSGNKHLIYPFVKQNKVTFKRKLRNPNVKSVFHAVSGNIDVEGNYVFPVNEVTSSYPLSASITRKFTLAETFNLSNVSFVLNRTASAMQNAASKYTTLSKHFVFRPTGSHRSHMYGYDSNAGAWGKNSTFLTRDITQEDVNFIFIPKIFYGSTIKKGSVNLKFYITGSLLAEVSDINQNGELIETTGSLANSVAGIVLYDEGIIMLTASHNLETGPSLGIKYGGSSGGAINSSWKYFGSSINDGISDHTIKTASFGISFKGTSYINTMTMFCHAKKGELNYSNNPTFRKYSDIQVPSDTTSSHYVFNEKVNAIKNVVSSSYSGVSETFQKTTYLSKVGIYDKDGNLIMIASTSKPIRKEEDIEYTFKLKIDL